MYLTMTCHLFKTSLPLAALTALGLVAARPANAVSFTGDYFTLPKSHPDVERGVDFLDGVDFEIVPGLVTPTLGPNDLPVVSNFGRTYSGPSGPITDINTDGEIRWWSTTSPYGVAQEKTQIDTLPFVFNDFYPDGFDSDASFFRTVHWRGTFNLLSSSPVKSVLEADDDAFLFIDRQLVADNGGVKPIGFGLATEVVSDFSAGTHQVDLFFADRHTTGSDIKFRLTPVPEPSSVLGILAFGAFGAGWMLKRKQKKQKSQLG